MYNGETNIVFGNWCRLEVWVAKRCLLYSDHLDSSLTRALGGLDLELSDNASEVSAAGGTDST